MCGSGHLVEKKDNSDPLENSVVDDCVEDCSEEKTVSVFNLKF